MFSLVFNNLPHNPTTMNSWKQFSHSNYRSTFNLPPLVNMMDFLKYCFPFLKYRLPSHYLIIKG